MKKKETIFITGSSSGIGRASAIALDKAGFRVLAGVRKAEDGFQLEKNLSKDSRSLIIDVSCEESVAKAAHEVAATVGEEGLFGLLNNAGVSDFSPIEALNINDLKHIYEINIFGVLRVTQTLLPLLRKRKGRIVNISSVGGMMTPPFLFPICSTKYVIESFTQALKQELAPWQIDVIAINPSHITTRSSHCMMDIVNERLTHFSNECRLLYKDRFLDLMKTLTEHEIHKGRPPEIVSDAIVCAFNKPHPKSHYPVGSRAKWMMLIARLFPQKNFGKLFDK